MRADRLLSILLLLQTKGRMTAHDLAERLEVSERTIYRDLEALGIAGIPVYAERGPGGGCELVDGYQTRLTGLTEAEVQALFLATMTGPLSDLGLGKTLDDALLKVSAALPISTRDQAEQLRQRVHLDAAWWYHRADPTSLLQTIQQALWQDQLLCLVYVEDDGAWSELQVAPYGLVAKAQVWYLVGSCSTGERVFRVARIQSVELMAESFVRPTDFVLASYWAEYCAQAEAESALYAAPLHLAPDEAQMLPQMLLAQDSLLAEQALEADAPLRQITPFHPRQQKKPGLPAAFPGRPVHDPEEKTLFVLNHAGEWSPLSHAKKKNYILTKVNSKILPAQRMQRSPIKKTDWPPTKKSHTQPPIKKTRVGAPPIKKSDFVSHHATGSSSQLNKKSNFQLEKKKFLPRSRKKTFIYLPLCA